MILKKTRRYSSYCLEIDEIVRLYTMYLISFVNILNDLSIIDSFAER